MMILAIDIGNTNVKLGVYRDGVLQTSFRFASNITKTSDEYGVNVRNGFLSAGLDLSEVTGVVMSSVIPSLNYTFDHMCKVLFDLKPLVVSAKTSPMKIAYDNPGELGSDRIATGYAAYTKYGGPLVVVDFGTATTFNCVNADGVFCGGMIFPGMRPASDALVSATAKLPRFELVVPETAIGKDTITNLQAGMFYGFLGAVERIVGEIRLQSGFQNAKTVITGGLAELLSAHTKMFDVTDRELSLYGLYLIHRYNAERS